MKIYIATKFENKAGFKELQSLLEAQGHEITHDWTQEEQGVKSGSSEKPVYPEGYLESCAHADIVGVEEADVLIFIPVKEPMAGAWVEMGIAIAHGIPVIVINNGLKNCIFFYADDVYLCDTLSEAARLVSNIK